MHVRCDIRISRRFKKASPDIVEKFVSQDEVASQDTAFSRDSIRDGSCTYTCNAGKCLAWELREFLYRVWRRRRRP